jgi:hypothetical protein
MYRLREQLVPRHVRRYDPDITDILAAARCSRGSCTARLHRRGCGARANARCCSNGGPVRHGSRLGGREATRSTESSGVIVIVVSAAHAIASAHPANIKGVVIGVRHYRLRAKTLSRNGDEGWLCLCLLL